VPLIQMPATLALVAETMKFMACLKALGWDL